jgi:hypothetical protein
MSSSTARRNRRLIEKARLSQALKAKRARRDAPPSFDDAAHADGLREIFALAQADLEAGKGYDVTLDDVRRQFLQGVEEFKAHKAAQMRERSRRR